MKFRVCLIAVWVNLAAFGASATWTGVSRLGWSNSGDPFTTVTDITGIIFGEDGSGASINGMIFTHSSHGETFIKSYDYSETAAPVNTIWLLAAYGDILGKDTLPLFKGVELCDYGDCGVGGDLIKSSSNFYLAFVAEDWEDYVANVENPHIWYGWANCAVNADGALDVLASGINLDGDPVRIGGDSATPEPSACLLMVMGIAALGLRRRWRMENESGKRKMGGRLTGRNFRFSPERHCGIIGANE